MEAGPLSICALTMTSFKNSIDLTLIPNEARFHGRSGRDSFESPAMKNGEVWGSEVNMLPLTFFHISPNWHKTSKQCYWNVFFIVLML